MIRCALGVGVVLVLGVAHPPAASADDTDLTVAVVAGALTMTGGGGDVDLGRAELDEINTTLKAGPATLNTIVITDTRAGDPGYNAIAQAADFVAPGGRRLDASALSWTPRLLSGREGITAGAPADGLRVPRVLVTAPAGGSLGTIEATADMTLNAPTSTRPGGYRTVLTLTVI